MRSIMNVCALTLTSIYVHYRPSDVNYKLHDDRKYSRRMFVSGFPDNVDGRALGVLQRRPEGLQFATPGLAHVRQELQPFGAVGLQRRNDAL